MSPICQTFVQNAWRKDLCSNCFKSKEEHGVCRNKLDYSKRSNYSTESTPTKRYVGVAGRSNLYGRNYYGKNSWNSLMIDNSNKESRTLKSPGLIKGMDSIIKQENEKNRHRDYECEDEQDMEVKPIPKSSVPNDSWIISQIIADTRNYNNKRRLSDKLQGDSSSDLGSDASNDTSPGSSASGCSGHYEFRNHDDMESAESELDSAHEEDRTYSPTEDQMTDDEDLPNKKISTASEPAGNCEIKPKTHGILKLTKSLPISRTFSVTFNEDNEVIGYGGDVDYSDGEDVYSEDEGDDDDASSVASSELTPEERELKRLTEKNTNFNSEEIDEQPSSMNEASQRHCTVSDAGKQDIKVKLKRSHPIGGTKPQLKSNLSLNNEQESSTPMKGIKPKFVSKDEEMRENADFEKTIEKSQKVTSIDNAFLKSREEVNGIEKVTSIDDLPPTPVKRSYASSKNKVNQAKQEDILANKNSQGAPDKKDSHTSKPSSTPFVDNNYDYTVKSAQVTMVEPSISKLIQQRNQRKSLPDLDSSKQNLEKVRSAVTPLNIINIQRRNSFMESQLNGSVYSHEHHVINSNGLDIEKPPEPYENSKEKSIDKLNSTSKVDDPSLKLKPLTSNSSSTPKQEKFQPQAAIKTPQSSFLHSGQVQPSTDTSKVNSVIYSSPEFNKENSTRSQPCNSTLTASTPTSTSIKGIFNAKPTITPKPKLPPKTKILSSRNKVEGTPVSKAPTTNSVSNLSSNNSNDVAKNSNKGLGSNSRDHLPTNTPSKCDDSTTYDVPVTISGTSPTSSTVSAPSPTSSSGYSSTSNISAQDFQESKIENAKSEENIVVAEPFELKSNSAAVEKPSNTTSSYRSKFEENRNILSTKLNYKNEHQQQISDKQKVEKVANMQTSNASTKDEKVPVTETPVTHTGNEQTVVPPYSEQENYPKPMVSENLMNKLNSCDEHSYTNLLTSQDTQDFDSFSSFTDDFDDDDDESTTGHYVVNPDNDDIVVRSERSSSATPMFRNSVGPVTVTSVCPLSVGDTIEGHHQPATRSLSAPRSITNKIQTSVFNKAKDSSSKFFFSRSGLFRPSSPPTRNRSKSQSERGRDRTKKSNSVFSLRKLLRFGGGNGDKGSKSTKDTGNLKEEESDREARKMKLQIIHPLDYNTTGVEVIARPEKQTPVFDTTDIYGSSNLESLQLSRDSESNPPFVEQLTRKATSLISFNEPAAKVLKKNSFLRKKKKVDRKESEKNNIRPPVSYVRRPSTVSDSGSCRNSVASNHLGFNSEGRPKPPPPPRKTSLQETTTYVAPISSISAPTTEEYQKLMPVSTSDPTSLTSQSGPALASNNVQNESESCSSSTTSSSSCTPHLNPPPPTRRIPPNSAKLNPPRPPKDHTLYANLGNARASFTPRKPGRSSSVKEDEKRKAPNPPSIVVPEGGKVAKGPAPMVPQLIDPKNHDYEYIAGSTPEKNEPNNNWTQSHSSFEKTLEMLSNMLDQLCNNKSPHYERLKGRISRWKDITLASPVEPIHCGSRLFYPATFGNLNITAMVTSETKLDEDPILSPIPIAAFREELPSVIVNPKKYSSQNSTTQGLVWILPQLSLRSLEEFSHLSQSRLQNSPKIWQRDICLFLLQLVTALKQLQARGIEESSLDLAMVIDGLENCTSPRLLLATPPESPHCSNISTSHQLSLCHCAAAATQLLLGHSDPIAAACQGPVLSPPLVPSPHAFTVLVKTLREERASSLTRAKCILEVMLFGPSNLQVSKERNIEDTLQKWLDCERSNVLQLSIKEQVNHNLSKASLFIKFRLMFLIRLNIKNLTDALRVLEGPGITDF